MAEDMNKKITEVLHQEFHKAEARALRKLKLEGLTQGQRAKGMVAYLNCIAVAIYEDHKKKEKEKMP